MPVKGSVPPEFGQENPLVAQRKKELTKIGFVSVDGTPFLRQGKFFVSVNPENANTEVFMVHQGLTANGRKITGLDINSSSAVAGEFSIYYRCSDTTHNKDYLLESGLFVGFAGGVSNSAPYLEKIGRNGDTIDAQLSSQGFVQNEEYPSVWSREFQNSEKGSKRLIAIINDKEGITDLLVSTNANIIKKYDLGEETRILEYRSQPGHWDFMPPLEGLRAESPRFKFTLVDQHGNIDVGRAELREGVDLIDIPKETLGIVDYPYEPELISDGGLSRVFRQARVADRQFCEENGLTPRQFSEALQYVVAAEKLGLSEFTLGGEPYIVKTPTSRVRAGHPKQPFLPVILESWKTDPDDGTEIINKKTGMSMTYLSGLAESIARFGIFRFQSDCGGGCSPKGMLNVFPWIQGEK